MTPEPFVVVEREQDTADTWTVELVPVSGVAPAIRPGQFVMVYARGVGEVPISVSATSVPGRVVLTVRDVGAVTHAICAAEPGDVLGLRGPFGSEWPLTAALGHDVVVVAGGIGLAPLRPAVRSVFERRSAYGRVDVLYGARTPSDLLYVGELVAWRTRAHVEVTVDAPDDGWHGRVGLVPALIDDTPLREDGVTALVCGPETMMRVAVEALLARGVRADRIALSLERDMRCGIGLCGHCQLGPTLICRDGPVYTYAEVAPWLAVREL